MPVTKLDPKTALLVIDLQKGIVSLPTAHAARQGREARPADDRRVSQPSSADRARERRRRRAVAGRNRLTKWGRCPPDWAELVPELSRQPEDHTVTKQTWGAFTNTDLDQYLKKSGVTQVVLLGVATSIGVESTARHAYENGYHVTLAVDAMTDLNADAHTNSISRIFPRLGETGTTQEIIDLLNTGSDRQRSHDRSQDRSRDRLARERSRDGCLSVPGYLQLPALGHRGRWSPMSEHGCSAPPRIGWSSPNSPTTTQPPSAWSCHCSSDHSCSCCP